MQLPIGLANVETRRWGTGHQRDSGRYIRIGVEEEEEEEEVAIAVADLYSGHWSSYSWRDVVSRRRVQRSIDSPEQVDNCYCGMDAMETSQTQTRTGGLSRSFYKLIPIRKDNARARRALFDCGIGMSNIKHEGGTIESFILHPSSFIFSWKLAIFHFHSILGSTTY